MTTLPKITSTTEWFVNSCTLAGRVDYIVRRLTRNFHKMSRDFITLIDHVYINYI